MARNVCVALGNWAGVEAAPALFVALRDPESLVRGHAAWALGRVAAAHGHERTADALVAALAEEPVEWVRAEIQEALGGLAS